MISMKVRSLTSVLSRLDDFNALKLIYLGQFLGLVENFKISTSVLYVEGDQIASSGLDEFFRILTLVLNVEGDQPGSMCWSCLALVIVSSRH